MNGKAPYAFGFQSILEEISEQVQLRVRGSLPHWLQGALIRTTPALYDLSRQQLAHWFDGLGLLYKFQINRGEIHYQSRFLHSSAYEQAKARGYIGQREFGTPLEGAFNRLAAFFSPPPLTDSGNANIIQLGGHFAAISESPCPVLFRPEDLKTNGNWFYDDQLEATYQCSHPRLDEDGQLIGLLVKVGSPSNYTLYRQAPGSQSREPISVIELEDPAYVHSFGMSENYLIIAEFPLLINPSRRRAGQAFLNTCRWDPNRNTRFLVIDRLRGELAATIYSEPYFVFHHVNAFEVGNRLFVDMLTYPDAAALEEYRLDHLQSEEPSTATAHLMRVELNLADQKLENEVILSETVLEFPQINSRFDRAAYRYCYGCGSEIPGSFPNTLVKIDVDNGSCLSWEAPHCFPGEPIFVPTPHAQGEDEGVLLSVVLNVITQRSFLLVLDAEDMQELARAEVPQGIPFGFHGRFFPDLH